MRVVGALFFLLLAGVFGFIGYALCSVFLSPLALRLGGVHAVGTCEGIVGGRYGSGVLVRYRTADGVSRTTRVYGWDGRVLPQIGDSLDIVVSRWNPSTADRWPVRTRSVVGSLVYLCLIGPFDLAALVWALSYVVRLGRTF
jgi:hypothetical protein